MSEQNPYKTLGLAKSASFDEIQAAKKKLSEKHQGDTAVVEQLEAAYDAIIMDRLRQRQQGTLEVPDQIRFGESQQNKATEPKVKLDTSSWPAWITDLKDAPEPQDLNLAFGINGAIAAAGFFLDPGATSTLLTVLLIANIYLLYRKEKKFGRAFLVGLGSFVVGIIVGSGINALLASQGGTVAIAPEQVSLVCCCLAGGLGASFLR